MMKSNFKKSTVAVAIATCLTLAPWLAEAAAMGRITVLSGLGQPLRAELEINASSAEMTAMSARLAPQEAFRQAGIDYTSFLLDLRFAVEKRGGQAVIKVSSSRPVNEPFLDFLVELNWPAGRLVREYTFLLDPPEIAAKAAGRPVVTVEAKVVEAIPGGSKPISRRLAPFVAPKQALASAAPQSQANSVAVVDTHLVQSGETLRKIAGETKPEGVSLEQMLVGLYKNNPDAFIGNNINRLKTGAILSIPDKATAEAVSQSEARMIYVAQANDWNAYRQKLATATAQGAAKDNSGGQSSAGKIAPKVEERGASADTSKDQVKLSRTELATQAKTLAVTAENAVTREKVLKEAQDRLMQLEKNVTNLQKLLETKNQKLANLQQQAGGKTDELKQASVPVVLSPKEAELAKPLGEPKPEPVKPVEVAQPPNPPKQPETEPGFVDELLGDPLPLMGGAAILALLGGYFFARRRRQTESAEATVVPSPSILEPNSVFRMPGGQSVDTGEMSPQTTDFSQTGLGTIDTDEVDPVAEADVYMAYRRDVQAEEILIEALKKDPQRAAIHAKLLEIYANRKSLKQFETLASELYTQTGGHGPEWAKVVALGVELDPENPLYASGRSAISSVFDADATMIVAPELAKATLAVSAEPSADAIFVSHHPQPSAAVDDISEIIDFDIAATTNLGAVSVESELLGKPDFPPEGTLLTPNQDSLTDAPVGNENLHPSEALVGNQTIVAPDLVAEPEPQPRVDLEPTPPADDDESLDFDIKPTDSAVLGQLVETPSFDIGSINLDLSSDAPAIPQSRPDFAQSPVAEAQPDRAPLATPVEEFSDVQREEVSTKLDLAKAYEEMGDLEGARELLQEVVLEGSPDLVEQAQDILGRIGE